MRVLCCLDGTNAGQVSKATEMLSASQPLTFGILYVIDTGPRKDIEHLRERFCDRPAGHCRARMRWTMQSMQPRRKSWMKDCATFPMRKTLQRQGRPEREIVNIAAEWQADLVVTCPRAEYGGKPTIGPKSVGHVRSIRSRPCSLSGAAGSPIGPRAISSCKVIDLASVSKASRFAPFEKAKSKAGRFAYADTPPRCYASSVLHPNGRTAAKALGKVSEPSRFAPLKHLAKGCLTSNNAQKRLLPKLPKKDNNAVIFGPGLIFPVHGRRRKSRA